jgi:phage terminase large subunit
VVIDEPAQIDPAAWPEVIRPTLSDYRGWATFIGTPKGHDWFYRVDRDEDGQELAGWLRLVLRASETGVLPEHELEAARRDLSEDQYAREYECSFDAAVSGAYFANLLARAKEEGRIGRVAADPLLPLRAFVDIGGSGAQADAFVIWIVQWVDKEIRVLDCYESVGQVLGEHLNWMRRRGYQNAIFHLPHDGTNANNVTGKRYVDHIREAQFQCEEPVPNQGRGAASLRIEATRRLMSRCWFSEATTEAGREALCYYHEKRDEERNIGLGPEHDWSSHYADAFGLMAICYEGADKVKKKRQPVSNTSWMSI